MKFSVCKTAATVLGAVVISAMWIGCSNDNKKAQTLFGGNGGPSAQDTSAIALRVKKIRHIFSNLPSTIKLMQILKQANAQYAPELTSDPTVVSKYSSMKGQALNLGVYAADLSYAGLFDQKNDASLFLQAANKLASSLGIPDAFNENIISRIEANMANQDSLLTIILQDFWTTDTYLKKNQRQEVSAYLVSGGWVEGLYIATQVAAKSNSQVIADEIGKQKVSLQDLADMMKTYPDSPGMQSLIAQIKKIQDVYSSVQLPADGEQTGKPILSGDQLKSITDAVTSVRGDILKEE